MRYVNQKRRPDLTAFYRPQSPEELFELLDRYESRCALVNGGTDIIIDISKKKISPEAIIYISEIPQLKALLIQKFQDGPDARVIIGSAVTYRALLNCDELKDYQGLLTAIKGLGSPAIRNMGTPAGNICTAAPAADCATMLMAMGADVNLASSEGSRTLPLKDMFLGRGKTACGPKEIVESISFPILREGEGSGYFRVARRKAQDIGKILAGVRLWVKDGKVEDIKIALGSLNANIVRAFSLEKELKSMDCRAAAAYIGSHFPEEAGLRPSYFKEYKEDVTTAVIEMAYRRALEDAERRSGNA